jgi:wyosine [tRNA(Phe)-imidazoG37] synthetase (radical SAM superfamily)
MQNSLDPGGAGYSAHPRNFSVNRYVYPVISRRARGMSIGVNLNPDKTCNFSFIYFQIDRGQSGSLEPIGLELLAGELDETLEMAVSGRIYDGPQFSHTPPRLRRLNDVAFSGDGEPTACPVFDRAVDICAELRRRRNLTDLKLVLITNATLLHQPRVRRALETLDANGGEIWAKLDAGTEEYYRLVDRSAGPWRRIIDNLKEAAVARPIVIQSLFMRIRGEHPSAAELDAYCDRLNEIVAAGGRIKLVQIHTVARQPAEPWVAALSKAEVDAIADLVRRRTSLSTAAFYGAG